VCDDDDKIGIGTHCMRRQLPSKLILLAISVNADYHGAQQVKPSQGKPTTSYIQYAPCSPRCFFYQMALPPTGNAGHSNILDGFRKIKMFLST
jgi:hypothetical protein